ncbi:MAG: M20 family peptidase [Clostridia bacterium]|nr:M20 family peptidase [Clostridia bacterium]
MTANIIQKYLSSNKLSMLALLERLVNIDNRTSNKKGVDEMGDIFKEEYEKLGFSVQVLKKEHCGNSAIARFEGKGRRIMLICHLDSVFPESMLSNKGNLFRTEGNLAYGPGVVDMKACLVGCLFAVKALQESGLELPSLSVLLAGDEELGSLSITSEIKEEGRRSDFCLVTEGARPGMAVVVERKGLGKVNISVEGRGAHAGNEPEKGINALLALCDVLPQIAALNNPKTSKGTLVTQLFAGEAPNVVPEKGKAYVDLRFSEMSTFEELKNEIEFILGAPRKDGAIITWETELVKPPMAPVEGFEELLNAVIQSGQELGIDYKSVKAGGITDGNTVASVGTPTIDGMGPVGGMMCSAEEFLELDTMVPCAARLALTIDKLK